MRIKAILVGVLFCAAGAQAQWVQNGGTATTSLNVGIGTTTAREDIDINRASGDAAFFAQTAGIGNFAYGRFILPANANQNNVQAGFFFQEGAGDNSVGNRFWQFGFNPVADTFAIAGGDPAVSQRLTIKANGFVGIGTTNPAVLLDVNGAVNVSGNIAAKYQDVAEWVNATEPLEAGTVVVLNPNKENEVMASSKAYDTAVAGVVSAKPGVILGEPADNKEKVATTGRVKVRCDARDAAIHIGDLLVTSAETGMAMKSEPVDIGGVKIHRPGTIIGKALEPLDKGEGEILVLLSLQ